MLTPKKKLSKREIKQDSLIKAYGKATALYYENKKYVSYALTAVVVIVVAIVIYTNNRRANEEKAAVELAKVTPLVDGQQYAAAIDGQPERGILGLKSIVDNYGSTRSGELARFYLAGAYYNLGQYDEALREFDDFSTGNPLLRASALAGMAGCYEAKGDFARAASYFEKAAGEANSPFLTPEYLNAAARAHGRAGDKQRAVTLYKRLKRDFPTSQQARDVDRYISEFSA